LPNIYNIDGSNKNRLNRKNAQVALGTKPKGGSGGGGGGGGVAGVEETDSEMMNRTNPPPNGQGSNYGKGAAPVKFTGEFAGPGSDDRFDLTYMKEQDGIYVDSSGWRYDDKGRKI
jgi:hypothetical protein